MLEIETIVETGPSQSVLSSPNPTVDIGESEGGFVNQGERDELSIGVLRLL